MFKELIDRKDMKCEGWDNDRYILNKNVIGE